jgi:PAS domain S-box-containing protein
MFQKLRSKTKLLLPLSVLIGIVLLLSMVLIYNQYTKSQSLKNLQNSIELATKISKFVHSAQKERGMTSGFLASHGLKFKQNLIKQRAITDKHIKVLMKYLNLATNKAIIEDLQNTLHSVDELKILRDKIDKFDINAEDSIKLYSKINDSFLNIIGEISKVSKIPIITQNILAYSNFLYAKESVGLERAIGTAILTQNNQNTALQISFINLIAIEKLYTKTFLKYASEDAKNYYLKNYKGKDTEEISKIINIILYKDQVQKHKINPEYWFVNITSKINKLKLIDNYLEKEILLNIKTELDKTDKLFNSLILLCIISISIFLLMVLLIIRVIQSKQRLKTLIDKYIISSTTDLKGKIIDVSDAFCNISGYTREELIGKPHNIIRHPDMPKSAFKDLWDTIQKGKSWDGEVKNLKKDGGYYWVYAHIEPLFDMKNKIEGYAAVRLDITDSVDLENELIRSKEKDKTLLHQSKLAQMGEMISMIAHQWRQPLTAISSTSSDLYMKIMLDNYTKEYFNTKLEKIDELSQHLSSTIDDFRNFYKEDKQKENIIYSEIAMGAFNIVSTSLEYKNISLLSEFHCQKYINVLVNELRQVVLNLIKNAEDILIEKEIKNPYIKVSTYDDETHSYLEVLDNGGGIPKEIMEKIFDPYFSTKTKKDGTGLGLYMSKIIIEEHCNGALLISNTEDGAKFTIKIPIAKDV